MVIISGSEPGMLHALFDGREVGTVFLPKPEKQDSRKHWIAAPVSTMATTADVMRS